MDSQNIKRLLNKYWNGETTIEEEASIKTYRQAYPEAFKKMEAHYFNSLAAFSELSLGEEFAENFMAELKEQPAEKSIAFATNPPSKQTGILRNFIYGYRKIAAAVLLFLAMSAVFYSWNENQKANLAQQVETQEAYEQAKEALALISSKLNKGLEVTYSLDKFSTTQDKIKTEN